jgi:endonuclease I
MKHLYFITFLVSTFAFAQVPSGYYDSANGLSGFALKTQLKKIIDSVDDPDISNAIEVLHNPQTYDALDGFNATYERDFYYEADGNTILDMYSENPAGADPYNYTPVLDECGNFSSEGDCYNKEHIIPQSVFSSQMPMYSDAHHLIPTDGRVNGFRSNFPFGVVNDSQLVSQSGITNPTQNGSKLGNNLNSGYSAGYSNVVFEPIDEFKGDIARIYFYFVTRYEDQISAWSSYPMFDGSTDKAIADPFLNILITWHQNDPVSQKEIDRNNNIFYSHQGNRNPFVDNPNYVNLIWSAETDTEAPSDPTNLIANNPTDNSIDLSWNASTDNVAVIAYDIYIDAVFAFSTANTNATTSGLTPDTNYCFEVNARDAAGNTSGFSNQACETTTNNGNNGDIDIFFSEYIEGSSNNKVLEIANFTGNNLTNMSAYTLKLSTNGNPSWTTTYNFPGNAQIANGDVYVIANGSSAVCTSQYDDLNNAITSFNGNDAIGLFKNDVLIDIIGTLGDDTTFGANTTLVRKPTIDTPNTVFDINEWDAFASNTCDDLGSHTQTLSVESTKIADISFFPNPVSGNVITVNSNNDLDFEIYNLLGKKVMHGQLNNNQISVSNLNAGVYLIKFYSGSQTSVKKLIKQ